MSAGKEIKSIRIQRGETMKEFGSNFNPTASDSFLSRWERAINLPNNERLKKIAELANISVNELLHDQTDVVTVKKVKNSIPTVIEVDGRTYIYQSPDQYKLGGIIK